MDTTVDARSHSHTDVESLMNDITVNFTHSCRSQEDHGGGSHLTVFIQHRFTENKTVAYDDMERPLHGTRPPTLEIGARLPRDWLRLRHRQ